MLLTTYCFASTPAVGAKVSNGVSCKKLNQKLKSGSKQYICDKNPFFNSTKLTWTLRECLETYELYVDSKDQYDIFKGILNSGGSEGKAEAQKLEKGINSLEVLMKTKVCKKGQ